MATFIDPAAAGANNGSSWTDAYQTWAAAQTGTTSFTTGGPYYVRYNTTQTLVASASLTGPSSGAAAVFISADGSGTSATYTVATTNNIDGSGGSYGITFTGSFVFYGLQFRPGTALTSSVNQSQSIHYVNCTLKPTDKVNNPFVTSGSYGHVKATNLVIDCASDSSDTANNIISVTATGRVSFVGLSFANVSHRKTTYAIGCSTTFQALDLEGCDFSNLPSNENCLGGANIAGTITAANCKTYPGVPLISSTASMSSAGVLTAVNCGSTDDPTNLIHFTGRGYLSSSTSIYRTGGATVSGTACSWKLATIATVPSEGVTFDTPWIYGVLSSTGSKTFTVYISQDGGSGDLTDAEVWLEVEYMGSSGVPLYTLGNDHRADITTTAAAQADDTTSTWTGITATYKQALAVTATVNEAGLYRARVVLGKASTTLYVDPLVTVS